MRLKTKYTLKDREGEEKIVREFAWLPLFFGEAKEKIWLEMVDVVYKIERVDIGGGMFSVYTWKWREDRFPTIEDYSGLPFEFPLDNAYNLCKKAIRNPLTWLFFDFLIILLSVFSFIVAIPAFLYLKITQCIALAMFRNRSNEV